MPVVNKYHPAWQIVRVKARSIKDPTDKVIYVMDWFGSNQSYQNFERVKNWVKMTAMGYRDLDKSIFEEALSELASLTDMRVVEEDYDFSYYDKSDLELVYKDLLKRKYGFQYKKVPQSHVEFMNRLTAYLGEST